MKKRILLSTIIFGPIILLVITIILVLTGVVGVVPKW